MWNARDDQNPGTKSQENRQLVCTEAGPGQDEPKMGIQEVEENTNREFLLTNSAHPLGCCPMSSLVWGIMARLLKKWVKLNFAL